METTIKNMELVLLEIKKNVINKNDSKASKILIHSYLTMLRGLNDLRLRGIRSLKRSRELGTQSEQLYLIKNHIKEVTMSDLLNKGDYVGVDNYATVLDKIDTALRRMDKSDDNLVKSVNSDTIFNLKDGSVNFENGKVGISSLDEPNSPKSESHDSNYWFGTSTKEFKLINNNEKDNPNKVTINIHFEEACEVSYGAIVRKISDEFKKQGFKF